MSVPGATDGIFCSTAPLSVANGQVWDGLFCLEEAIIAPPIGGGGGSGPGVGLPGENYYNQAPYVKRDEPIKLQQALQEDEELIIMLKAFVETIRWH